MTLSDFHLSAEGEDSVMNDKSQETPSDDDAPKKIEQPEVYLKTPLRVPTVCRPLSEQLSFRASPQERPPTPLHERSQMPIREQRPVTPTREQRPLMLAYPHNARDSMESSLLTPPRGHLPRHHHHLLPPYSRDPHSPKRSLSPDMSPRHPPSPTSSSSSSVSSSNSHLSPVSPAHRKPIDFSVGALARPHVADSVSHHRNASPPGVSSDLKDSVQADLFEKENRYLREQRKCAKDPQSPPNVTVCQRAIAHPLFPVCHPNGLFSGPASAFHHPMTSLYINTGPLSVSAAAAAAAVAVATQHRSPTTLPHPFPLTPGQMQQAMATHREISAHHHGNPLPLASHQLAFLHRQSAAHIASMFPSRVTHADSLSRYHPYALSPVTPETPGSTPLGLLSCSPSPASPPASSGSPSSYGGGARHLELSPGVVKPVPTHDVHHKLTSSPEGKVSA